MSDRIIELSQLQPHELINIAMRRLDCRSHSELARWLGYNKSTICRWNQGDIDNMGLSMLELLYLMEDNRQINKFKRMLDSRYEKARRAFKVKSQSELSAALGVCSFRPLNYHYTRFYDALECLYVKDVEDLKRHRGVL